MVAMDGSLGSRAAVRSPGRVERAPEASVVSRVPISVITLIVAIGVFVSSMGYASGRAGDGPHSGPGTTLYWIGQALILVPIACRLLSRGSLSNGGIVTLIAVLTIAEYFLKCNYDPLGFAFNDEFLHWRGTTNMLQSGKLFELNYGLPIGTHYPGIEEVTSALVSATGLSVFEAGLVVAGVAHSLFILFLYLAFVVAIRSHRIAGIAVLIYFAAPSLTSFNSMFVYETLALAFLGMCIVAGLRSAIEPSASDRRRWFIVAVLCILATVITHHVTSYMLTGFLALVALASRLTGSRNTAGRFGVLALISALSVAAWIAFIARDTISYFSPTVVGMAQSLKNLTNGGASGAASTSSSPFSNTVLERRPARHHIADRDWLVAGMEAVPAPPVDHRHDDRRHPRLDPLPGDPPRDLGRPGALRAGGDLHLHPGECHRGARPDQAGQQRPHAPLGRRGHRLRGGRDRRTAD